MLFFLIFFSYFCKMKRFPQKQDKLYLEKTH